MFHNLQSLAQGAVMQRATLLANHVISSEPVAVEHLRPHAGSSLQVEFPGWPSLLPALPTIAFRISPAGLVEWLGDERLDDADLHIEVDASNPALSLMQALTGARPRVTVSGNAALAADVNWLIDNLRWDVQDDLARLVGAAPADAIGRLARVVADGMRQAKRTLSSLVGKGAPGTPGGPPSR